MSTFLSDITVEPSFLLYQLTYEIIKFINSNLYLQKTCRFNQTTEPNLETACDDEESGLLFASQVNSVYYLANNLISLAFSILATSWSDEAGRRRRPLVFLPIIGQILQGVSGCLHSYFWTWSPVPAALFEVIFESFTGGTFLLTSASQMYVCDISTIERRTMRLGVLGTIATLSLLIGDGGAGFILRSFGFFYSFLLCFLLSTTALVLGVVFMKDTSVPVRRTGKIYRILTLKSVFDSFRVIFNKNLGGKRIVVVLLLLISCLGYFILYGEISLLYLYLRYKFKWNEPTYSAYLLYRFTGAAIGNLLTSVVLSKRLEIHDGLIGMFSAIFDMMAAIILLFATQNWQLFMFPILDTFHNNVIAIGASFMSKYFECDQFGRLNAVFSVFAFLTAFSYTTYNMVFQGTLYTFPSAFCIVSVGLNAIIVLLFGISYLLSKKFEEPKRAVKEEKPMLALVL